MAAPQDNKSLEKSTEGLEQDSENPSSSVSIDVPLDTTTSSESDDFIESDPAILDNQDYIRTVWGRRFPFNKKFLGRTPAAKEAASSGAISQRNDNVPEQQVEQPTNAQVGARLQQDVASTSNNARLQQDVASTSNNDRLQQDVDTTSNDAQSQDDAVEQRMDPQFEILSNNCCTALYVCYMDAVIEFRNSSLIYLIQILMSIIPLSGIVFGFSFLFKCPKAVYLPGLCAGLGIVGLLFIGLWMAISSINRRGDELSTAKKIAFVVFSILLVLASIADAVLVNLLVPSTDPASQDYCDDTFYTYSYYKEMATAAAIGVSLLIYLPEICRALWCEDCLMRHSRPYYVL